MSTVRVNFALNVGEVSARFEARQDKTDKYGAGCRVLENWLPLTMGGVVRRPGWKYVAKSKFSGLANSRVVLVDFRFSSEQAYVLEFGDFYVRFFKDGEPVMDVLNPTVVQELVTPWGIADLDRIKIGCFQSADVMYICTGIYAVRKLARVSASPDEFTLTSVAFNPPATIPDEPTGAEIGSGNLTLSALTGDAIIFTSANACFLAGDSGRMIVSGAARAIITSVTNPNSVIADAISDFTSLTIVQDDWHFSGFGDVEMDVDRRLSGNATPLDANIDVFRTSDVGKYLTIYGGLIKLMSYVNTKKMNVIILNTLRDVPNDPSTGLPFQNPRPTTVWTMEIDGWTDALGYPTCGCFFQSRMWLCKEQTINGSVTGDYENFSKGSNADDAIQVTLDDDQINPIRWIKGLRSLQMATGGSAYEATASTAGKALTPSDFNAAPISSRGTALIPPVRIGGQLIYVQFGQKKMRELVFDFVTDKFKSPSLFVLAEHLTEENFVMDSCFQQEPDSVIWAVRDDGVLMALTYQEDEQVIGWSRHPTTGEVTSICTIPRPSTGKDWLWAAIEREINDVTETYIEFMEPDADVDREWHNLQTDCAAIAVPDANLLVIGADRLEGATVRVIGDGMLFNDAVVTAGQFTLDPAIAVSQVEYGLNYDSEGLTLEPPIMPQEGGMFTCRRWKQLGVRVRRCGPGLTLNVEDSAVIGLPVRRASHLMDAPTPLQEGKLCANQTNWGAFARVRFKQTLPFPAEIMNIVGELELGTDWCCETVDEGSVFPIIVVPPEPPPIETCTDITPRGQQILEILDYFINPYPTSANTRTSWGFVGDNEEIYSLVGFAECAGGNMAYVNSCCLINHFVGGGPAVDTFPLGLEDPLIPFINTRPGSSDRITWAAVSAGGAFSFENGPLKLFSIPVDEFGSTHMEAWAVMGDELWIYSEHNGDMTILQFDIDSLGLLNNYTPWGTSVTSVGVSNMQLTANYLYCLSGHDATNAISKISRTTGALVAEFDVTGLNPAFISVADDNLIYLLCGGSPAKVYYLENFTTFVYVGNTPGQGFTPFGLGTGIWKNGAIYYGSNGFGGFNPDIFKLAIACPPEGTDPIVATIATDVSTVAAGSPINVIWSNLLIPNASDEIWLVVAPAAGELGYAAGPTGSGINTTGTSDGSLPFTISIATPPGDYVFMLLAHPGVYVAQSAVFTVT